MGLPARGAVEAQKLSAGNLPEALKLSRVRPVLFAGAPGIPSHSLQPGSGGPVRCDALEFEDPENPGRRHQIAQSSERTIGSPALQEKAFANSGRLEGAPIARNRSSGCGFVLVSSRANSGRSLVAQTWAQARKKRWSAVNPSIFAGSGLPCAAALSAL